MAAQQSLTREEMTEFAQALKKPHHAASQPAAVREYDFARPEKLSKANWRALQMVYSALDRLWSRTLSGALRTDVSVRLSQVAMVEAEAYAGALIPDSVVFQLSLEPLRGHAVMDIPPVLALCMVDRLTGGSGAVQPESRLSGEITRELVQHLAARMVADLSEAWVKVVSVQPALLRTYESAAELSSEISGQMLFADIACRIGDVEGSVSVGLQAEALDPIIGSLDPQRWVASDANPVVGSGRCVADSLHTVELTASVELGRARVSMREVLDMDVGDVIRLESAVNDLLDIRIGSGVKFHGRPGLAGTRLAVQITDFARQEPLVTEMTGPDAVS